MLWLGATVDADASAALCRWILDGLCPIGRFAIGRFAIGDAWNVLHDRQAALEPRRLGDGYMVAEGGDLVANTLKGVAVPTSVDNKTTCNGVALGLVADKFDVHIFRVLFFVAVLVVNTDQTTGEGEYFAKGDEDGVMYLSQWWNHKPRY